ncbi:MAG: hypothetical protein ACI9AU_001430, partial [Bacteroidia bacterium]
CAFVFVENKINPTSKSAANEEIENSLNLVK